MTGLDYFTFVVLAVLVGAALYFAFVLGALPGRIAEQRAHPNADAVRVAGWLGLLTLGLLWPLALIWAYLKPTATTEVEPLRESVERLAERVSQLEARGAGRTPESDRGGRDS
jgi:hypothetical protein